MNVGTVALDNEGREKFLRDSVILFRYGLNVHGQIDMRSSHMTPADHIERSSFLANMTLREQNWEAEEYHKSNSIHSNPCPTRLFSRPMDRKYADQTRY